MFKRSSVSWLMFLVIAGMTLLPACAAGKRAPILDAGDMQNVGTDPTASCLVFGGFSGLPSYGSHDTISLKLETAGGNVQDATVKKKGFTELIVPIVFTNIPKGDFKPTWALFNIWTGKMEGYNYKMEKTTFGSPGVGKERSFDVGGHSETLPADMAGKCEGGFIWLGIYEMKHGGIFSSSKLTRAKKSFEENQRPRYIESLKEQFKGTPWESAIK